MNKSERKLLVLAINAANVVRFNLDRLNDDAVTSNLEQCEAHSADLDTAFAFMSRAINELSRLNSKNLKQEFPSKRKY